MSRLQNSRWRFGFVLGAAAVLTAVQWCLATDVLTTAITALALLRLGAAPAPAPVAPARPYPKRRPKGSRGANRKPKRRARSR